MIIAILLRDNGSGTPVAWNIVSIPCRPLISEAYRILILFYFRVQESSRIMDEPLFLTLLSANLSSQDVIRTLY